MIGDIIYLFIGTFFHIIDWLLGLLNYVFPTTQVTNSIVYLASYITPLGAFIDLPTLVSAVGYFMAFLTLWYSYKIILFLFNISPIGGTHPIHPTI